MPASTLRLWSVGQHYRTAEHDAKLAQPLIRVAKKLPATLSFWNLVELYVLASIRRRHGIAMPQVRKALSYVETKLHVDRPLIQQRFMTDGVELFVEKYSTLVSASGQGQLIEGDLLRDTLRRIDADPKGLALRMSPWIESPGEVRSVEIDPERAFGRLVVAGTAIPTESIAERFRAGDAIHDLAEDFRLTQAQIEAALRWEQRASAA